MLPYAELVRALATVPRVTLHGPWSRTIDDASSKHPTGWCLAIFTDRLRRDPTSYIEVIDTSLSLSQRLP